MTNSKIEVIQIFYQARTAHLEAIEPHAPAVKLLYHTRSYDFDAQLAEAIGAQQGSTFQALVLLANERPRVVELNEPAYVKAWPRLLAYTLFIRAMDFIFRTRTLIVTHALENHDIAQKMSSAFKLPYGFSQMAVRLISKYLVKRYDKIAYATRAAEETYIRLAGKCSEGAGRALFPAIDSACKKCSSLSKRNIVCFLGSFTEHKGIKELLRAWPRLYERNPSHTLVLAGKGALEKYVATWCHAQPVGTQIVIDPSRSDIHALLAQSRVVVLLSQPTKRWTEQIGLPITEGLAHGCEIVATDQTGIALWLRDHGHQVIKYDAPADEVAAAINRAITSGRKPEDILQSLPPVDGHSDALQWMWSV